MDDGPQELIRNKMHLKKILLLLFSLLIFVSLDATHAQQGMGFGYTRDFLQPEPFEKVYITGASLLSMPQGTFYKNACGHLEKVRCVSHDCNGMYFLRVHTQCPLCGAVYSGRECSESMNCPLYEKEIAPGIWN